MQEVAIVIPARGGSKRILGKNILDLNGLPLVAHAIKTSLIITPHVFVSTDCDNISKISKEHGALVLKRPPALSGDMSPTSSAISHFLDNVPTVETFACVQATSPLLPSRFLDQGFEKINGGGFDSVISTCYSTGFFWNGSGSPINFPLLNRPRTQDMEKWHKENGAFYITSRKAFTASYSLMSGRVGFVTMPEILSFEIDTIEDFKFIEKLYPLIKQT